ncbi:MAG: bifunctional nuclease family protein [Crenarchaeota archaeon]|nr:bifunctional nuclease family protein [Thermoproteota archaeon]
MVAESAVRPVEELLKVVDVEAGVEESIQGPYRIPIPKITCKLEDSREFVLYHVPYEIVKAINKMKGEYEENPKKLRQSLFDILPYFESAVEQFRNVVEKVVVDELDPDTGLYTAKLYLDLDKVKMKIPMIPSHAIYLALITEKPIYVKRELVDKRDELGDFEL